MNELIVISKEQLISIISEVVRQELSHVNREKLPDTEPDEFLNALQVVIMLKISKPTLYKRMKDGTIPYKKVGRRLLFSKNEIINQLNKHSNK